MEDERKKRKGSGAITISTTISLPLWEKCHNKISWSEALRIGATELLSKAGDEDYINPLQQSKKLENLVKKIEELAQENAKLQEENLKLKQRGL